MRRARDDLDRLLAGEPPAELARVAAVLRAAGAPPADAELAGATRVAAAMRAAAEASSPRRVKLPRAISMRRRVAVVALAAALTTTGGLAAAGELPEAAQNVAHDVLGKIGIHVPNANAGSHPYERGKSGNTKPKKFGPAPTDSPEPAGTAVPARGNGYGRPPKTGR